MNKNKDVKNNKDTIKKLKLLIVFSGIISVIMEFDLIEKIIDLIIKDVEDLGPVSFVLSIKAHFQQHGNFYENIALGGLASAFVSIVAVKVFIDNYREEGYLSCNLAAFEMVDALFAVWSIVANFKNINQWEELNYGNQYFKDKTDNFIKTIKEYNEDKNPAWEFYLDIYSKTCIPYQEDIRAFLLAMKESIWFNESAKRLGWKEDFFQRAWYICADKFNDETKIKYNIAILPFQLSHRNVDLSPINAKSKIRQKVMDNRAKAVYDVKNVSLYKQLIDNVFENSRAQWEKNALF